MDASQRKAAYITFAFLVLVHLEALKTVLVAIQPVSLPGRLLRAGRDCRAIACRRENPPLAYKEEVDVGGLLRLLLPNVGTKAETDPGKGKWNGECVSPEERLRCRKMQRKE